MKKAGKISGEHMAETILKANKGCFACPIACVQMTKVEDPAFQAKALVVAGSTMFAAGPPDIINEEDEAISAFAQ